MERLGVIMDGGRGEGIEWAKRKRSSQAGNRPRNEEIGISGRQSRVQLFMVTVSGFLKLIYTMFIHGLE